MALENLKILTKLEELDAYSHQVVLQFPKYERHVLAADIRHTLASIIRHVIRAAKRVHKKTTLDDLDIEVEYLRSLIRKAHALKYISMRRYEIWMRHVNEIGSMLGGWIKTSRGAKQE